MSSKIQQTQKKSYKEILTSTISFHIPTFQRAYNWKPKQVLQLWQSILENDNQYYIGNIVVVQHSTENIQSGYLVIDGQQRLTTLSLFLVAIRNYISKDSEKDKKKQNLVKHKDMMEELRSSLIFSTSFSDESKIKLIFSKSNLSEVYKKLVYDESLEENLDEAQERFVKNLNHISILLREYLKESKSVKQSIQELVTKIMDLEFIIIECRNESDVYQIFEGLNSTGLELSVVDLVKNTVFRRIKGPDGNDLANAERIWEEMENNFEASKINLFSKFLRHQWISKYGYINNSQLYDSIKKKLDNEMHNNSEVIQFIENMRDDASLYIALRIPDHDFFVEKILGGVKDINVVKYLSAFELLDSDQVFEVLLSYCRKFVVTEDYTKGQFISDIKNLWNLGLMIKIIASVNPSKYEKLFADRCKELAIYSGKNYNKESNNFYSELWNLVKDRKSEFTINFNDLLAYKKGNDKNNELIRFILLAIYQKKNKEGVTYETKSVEHILSQKKYELEDYLHHIGNLTILSQEVNRRAGDKDFSVKYKEYYSKDIFEHNKELNKYNFEEDPIKATSERAKELGEEAFNIFSFI